jgi:hypothetical protein
MQPFLFYWRFISCQLRFKMYSNTRFYFVLSMVLFSLFSQTKSIGQDTLNKPDLDPYMLHLAQIEIVQGDTQLVVHLPEIFVWSTRYAFTAEQQNMLYRYRVYAYYVRPFAIAAVKNYNELQVLTQDLSRRDRRKLIKAKQEELEKQFASNIKKLTKTQGKILIKMIEYSTQKPMYDILKELKGGFTASYWNAIGLIYDHHLKRGYEPGKDPYMDIVLKQYPLTTNY